MKNESAFSMSYQCPITESSKFHLLPVPTHYNLCNSTVSLDIGELSKKIEWKRKKLIEVINKGFFIR